MSNTQLSLKELHDRHLKLEKGSVIIDVRNPDEFKSGHIKGALNFPLPEISQHTQELQQYQQVYLHCKRGGRAKTAFETLKNAGLNNLVCIHDGGMDLWIESGYPVEK